MTYNCNGTYTINGYNIESFDVVPNSFVDMIEMNNTNSISVKLYNIVSDDCENDTIIDITMEHFVKNDAYLIVLGGWIPCSCIAKNTLLLADRNIVSEIIRRYSNGKKKVNEEFDSFDNIFLNMNICLDLLPFVLEGNAQKLPENEQIDEQYNSAYNDIKLALPELNIATYPAEYYYKMKNTLAPIINKRIIFLQKIAPKINKQFRDENKEEAVKLVFKAAEEANLKKDDLVVLLALLRIIIKGNKSPAQLVLKDSQNYSKENAYNAIFDLVTIEFLINYDSFYHSTQYKKAFITRDKGLSLFSSMFNNIKISSAVKGKLVITSTLPSEIFGNDEKLINLYKKWLTLN